MEGKLGLIVLTLILKDSFIDTLNELVTIEKSLRMRMDKLLKDSHVLKNSQNLLCYVQLKRLLCKLNSFSHLI